MCVLSYSINIIHSSTNLINFILARYDNSVRSAIQSRAPINSADWRGGQHRPLPCSVPALAHAACLPSAVWRNTSRPHCAQTHSVRCKIRLWAHTDTHTNIYHYMMYIYEHTFRYTDKHIVLYIDSDVSVSINIIFNCISLHILYMYIYIYIYTHILFI